MEKSLNIFYVVSQKEHQNLYDACSVANKIFFDVLNEIKKRKEDFLLSTASPEVIADLMLDFIVAGNKIKINTYYTRNKRVMGYFVASKPNDIFLNRATFPRKIESLVSTFYHEFVHAVDAFSKVHRFGHGNNKYMTWKEETAPYWIDNVAHKIACEKLKTNSKNIRPTVIEKSPIWSLGLITRFENHLEISDELQHEDEGPNQNDSVQDA